MASPYKINIPLFEGPLDLLLDLIKWITPVRKRRLDYEHHPKKALEILDAGSAKARESAKQTMERVRNSIFNWPRKRNEISG